MTRRDGAFRQALGGRRVARIITITVTPAVVAVTVSVFAARANPALGHVPGQIPSIAIAAAAGLALLLRRRFPVAVLLVTAVAFAADTVVVPLMVAVYTAAAHERTWWKSASGILAAVAAVAVTGYGPASWGGLLTGILLAVAAPALIGMYVGARRSLITGLRERAVAAEREGRLAAENARLAERARIARDMHDALGHQVTLISIQAAVLEVMPAASDPTVRERVRIIADTSRDSLTEVRQILGLLDTHTTEPGARNSTGNIERLVEDARRLGISAIYTADLDTPLPDPVADVVYRIVQEGLTNAAKHAPGAHVTVAIDDRDGIGVTITSSAPTPGAPAVAPRNDGGHGLPGLRARVRDAGGMFTASATDDGGFQLKAWLPLSHGARP